MTVDQHPGLDAFHPVTQSIDAHVSRILVVVDPTRWTMSHQHLGSTQSPNQPSVLPLGVQHIGCAGFVADATLQTGERHCTDNCFFQMQILDTQILEVPAVAMVSVHAQELGPAPYRYLRDRSA